MGMLQQKRQQQLCQTLLTLQTPLKTEGSDVSTTEHSDINEGSAWLEIEHSSNPEGSDVSITEHSNTTKGSDLLEYDMPEGPEPADTIAQPYESFQQ